MTAMLEGLVVQAEAQGAARVTLRALVEEASEVGAARALRTLGLMDDKAGPDIIELRQLIQGWRDAKRSALSAGVAWVVRTCVAIFLFGVPDSGGDVVLPGAFAGAGRQVPLLWQHDAKEPIGFVESMREDGRGLRVVARVVASGRGAQAAQLLRAGAIDGLSFGYRVKASRPDRTRGLRKLASLDLIEVSLVTFPMQPLARVLGFSTVAEETMNDL